MHPRFLLVVAIAIASITGCASSNISRYYTPIQNAPPSNTSAVATPGVYAYGPDIRLDEKRLMRDGFIPLGFSAFNGALERPDLLTKQARVVGATLVMVKQVHTQTRTGVTLLPMYEPSATVTSNSSGRLTVNGPSGTSQGSYSARTTTHLPASTSYVPIPYSVDLYDQIATFWTKPQSSYWTCGVVVAEVDTKTRKELGSNRGVLVDVVVTGTPAFHADILEGDVLLSINRKPIFGAAAIKSLCDSYRGEDVIFEVYRDGRNISLAARLDAN